MSFYPPESMRNWISPLFFLLVFACSGASSTEVKETEKEVWTIKPKKEKRAESPKKWKSWRWKGKRDECYFAVENQCFESKKQACKKLSCKTKCIADDGAPAVVSCAEK